MQFGWGTTHCADSDESDQRQQTRLTPMKSTRQILLGGMLAVAVMAVSPSPLTQQNNGKPGSPHAPPTIYGKKIPPPHPQFGGGVKEAATHSQPYRPPPGRPPQGA